MQSKNFHKTLILVIIVILISLPAMVRADRIDELENKIEETNSKVQEIQKDINKYTQELNVIRAEKQTLQSVINELDTSRKKVNANINLTQNEIDNAIYNIERFTLEIREKEQEIGLNTEAIGETVRLINEKESQTFAEAILGYDNLSDFWYELDSLQQFQAVVRKDLQELYDLKTQLQNSKKQLQTKEHELSQLKTQLFGQRSVIDNNKAEKDSLLQVTKSEESTYQKLLAEKIRQREIFLSELASIEEELRITIDPTSIPSSGSGVLSWPLDKIVITQYFGNTPFASANPQIYSGRGHNGVDFSASSGSRIKSSLSGTVTATGNTDLQQGCYSYGKWVLVKHNNGLSSLYAHLSVISVNPGQVVKTGDILGFSGNTGYSTGPHLHFTVFATEGVRVVRLGDVKTVTNCGNMKIPVAPQEAYLNPLSYL